MQGQIRNAIERLEAKLEKIRDYWEEREIELSSHVQFTDLEHGIKTVRFVKVCSFHSKL
jgi:hypothetical protein